MVPRAHAQTDRMTKTRKMAEGLRVLLPQIGKRDRDRLEPFVMLVSLLVDELDEAYTAHADLQERYDAIAGPRPVDVADQTDDGRIEF